MYNIKLSRRQFIRVLSTASAGLVLGVQFSGCSKGATDDPALMVKDELDNPFFEANAFITIFPDNRIRILIKHLDMGQGAFTGLATLVTDEMDADWGQVFAEHAPANATLYGNWGNQATFGSEGLKNNYLQMREAGALVRQIMIEAAAKTWDVSTKKLSVEKGQVINTVNGEKYSFGELVKHAKKLDFSKISTPKLKQIDQFNYIGKPNPRLDLGKEDGKAIYTQDVVLPNMLTALVAHAPRFNATVQSFNTDEASKIVGIEKIFRIPSGVAVVASDFWTAKKARDLLQVKWNFSDAETASSDTLMEQYKELAKNKGAIAAEKGNADKVLSKASDTLAIEFEFPFLAHATMEPMDCVARVDDDTCELWSGIQSQTSEQNSVSKALGIQPDKVKINTLFAGGSFGRRIPTNSDYVLEAVNIAKEFKGRPVKLLWTREDDMSSGMFRPMYYHRVEAALDKNGKISAWKQKIVGQGILDHAGVVLEDGVDITSVEGSQELPYKVPHHQLELHTPKLKVPACWWRSVAHNHNACVKEVTIDYLARMANEDPIEFRLTHFKSSDKGIDLIEFLVTKYDWNKSLPEGWGRGFAIHQCFGTYVAQVVEVSTQDNGQFKLEKVICVVNCGLAVNPDIVEAQMQGGIGYGLGPVLGSEVTLDNGAVVQKNFDSMSPLRISDMPDIEVHIFPSTDQPTGVGEPSTCVIAPAVVNALANARGKYLTKFPIRKWT